MPKYGRFVFFFFLFISKGKLLHDFLLGEKYISEKHSIIPSSLRKNGSSSSTSYVCVYENYYVCVSMYFLL